jgi:ribosome production factor 2
MLRQVKPKTAAGSRAIKAKEPVAIEGAKQAILLKSTSCNFIASECLKEIHLLKKPDSVLFNKRNDVHPFDDYKPLEFFSLKNDASFVVVGSHSKKRPNNLVFARMFGNQLLDMLELGLTDMKFAEEFKNVKHQVGNRPLMLFNGEAWTANDQMQTLKSMFLDFFTGDASGEHLDLRGVSHLISVTADGSKIYFRTYGVIMKKSGVKIPKVELEEIGPHFDFVMRRATLANPETLKVAMKIPKELKQSKVKNVDSNDFGEKTGRVWVDKQDFDKMQTRKMKGLKRKFDANGEEEEDNQSIDEELEAEFAN